MQGTFGALEKLSEVYSLVWENIYHKERNFILFEPTPRKVYNEVDKTLYALGMVPQAKLWFAWDGDDPMEGQSQYVLDIEKLKSNILN